MTTSENPCPFCGLHDPDVTVYRDEHVQALVNRRPINRYHVIIVPLAHVERLADLPPMVASAAIRAAQIVGTAIRLAAGPDGITYITEDDFTGQGYNLVAHWKLHVIARFRDDAVRLEWHRDPDPGTDVRAEIATRIRAHVVAVS
jgi:histidine triad (HIT) family protein